MCHARCIVARQAQPDALSPPAASILSAERSTQCPSETRIDLWALQAQGGGGLHGDPASWACWAARATRRVTPRVTRRVTRDASCGAARGCARVSVFQVECALCKHTLDSAPIRGAALGPALSAALEHPGPHVLRQMAPGCTM